MTLPILLAVAQWITGSYQPPAETNEVAFFEDAPAPVLLKSFSLEQKPIAKAVWRIVSPSLVDATVNGTRITATPLTLWTSFDARVIEDEYDVSALLKSGENKLRFDLGNGWWNPLPMRLWKRFNLRENLAIGVPVVRATLLVTYADGSQATVETDTSWQAAESNVLRNNLYLGEKRDLRKALSNFTAARVVPGPKGTVVPRGNTPRVIIYDRWQAKGVTALGGGKYIVDMGVNFAGTLKATFHNTQDGDVIQLRYGECLTKDGQLNPMTSVCCQIKDPAVNPPGIAEACDRVICPTAAEITYEPRFTWHGYRYVEVSGLRTPPQASDFEALAWSADLSDSATFECSNPKLNLLCEVARRTFRSNLQGVQSDCPARERFGYGGDLAATAESFILNYNMADFYRKVVRDRCDSEELRGRFTTTSPAVFDKGYLRDGSDDFTMGWAVDVPIVVDLLWRYYGDRETMYYAYPHLVRYLDNFAKEFSPEHVPPCIGDHESLDKADLVLTAMAHYHQFLKLTAKFANILGESGDYVRFNALADKVASVFAARYVDWTGAVGNNSESAFSFALYHDLVPHETQRLTYARLLEAIHARQNALTTGIFSTQYIFEVLTAHGDAKLAGELLTHEGFPGWFHMLDRGATSLWETWAESDNVYSQDHPMFGSCAAWMMRGILGIRIADDAVACDKVVIDPHPVAGLTWAKGSYMTPKGPITVSWKLENGELKVEKSVPPGITLVESKVPAWNALGDRETTLKVFLDNEFGVRPVERPPFLTFAPEGPDRVMMEGAALRKRIRITYGGKYGTNSFVVTAFIPRHANKPVPAFLLICNRNAKENIDPTRENKSGFWPAEAIVKRGYAALAFYNGDLAPDWNTGNRKGVFECFEDMSKDRFSCHRWATLSAWAWGASRVMDWIETEPLLDAKKVAVVGHSRGGKTALLTGVTDTRFAMACVNCSGCAGAKLNRMDLPKSEHVSDIVMNFPYWFTPMYTTFVNAETEAPFDQHQLLALMAPRLLCVADATKDDWAGPKGEFEACRLASPAWEAQGLKGLCADTFPPPEQPIQEGNISYHLRTGIHNLTPYDWGVYMDFAQKHGW